MRDIYLTKKNVPIARRNKNESNYHRVYHKRPTLYFIIKLQTINPFHYTLYGINIEIYVKNMCKALLFTEFHVFIAAHFPSEHINKYIHSAMS